MNTHTKEEIIEKLNSIWDRNAYDKPDFDVTIYTDRIDMKITRMYEPPGLSFRALKELSEFFGTDNINDDDRISESGCETCDYGSCYGFVLTVRP